MIIILTHKEIDSSNQELVIDLYRKSFPHKERDSIHQFLNHDGKEGRIIAYYDNNDFIGFSLVIIYKDIVNISYLAIKKEHQGHGYGHQILEIIKSMYQNHKIIADIEKDEESCPNQMIRKKRELFYLHDDFKESGIEYSYNKVDYVLMIANGNITHQEFKEFWSHFAFIDDLGKYIKHHF